MFGFELADEDKLLKDTVHRFVSNELMPLESAVLVRESSGSGFRPLSAERKRIDRISKDLGFWGLDAPRDVGGSDLSAVTMAGVNEELGGTVTPYTLPPGTPDLRMLMGTVTDRGSRVRRVKLFWNRYRTARRTKFTIKATS